MQLLFEKPKLQYLLEKAKLKEGKIQKWPNNYCDIKKTKFKQTKVKK